MILHGTDEGWLEFDEFPPQTLVADVRYEDLRRVDAGEGETVPHLEEVINLCKGKIGVNLEIKGTLN